LSDQVGEDSVWIVGRIVYWVTGACLKVKASAW